MAENDSEVTCFGSTSSNIKQTYTQNDEYLWDYVDFSPSPIPSINPSLLSERVATLQTASLANGETKITQSRKPVEEHIATGTSTSCGYSHQSIDLRFNHSSVLEDIENPEMVPWIPIANGSNPGASHYVPGSTTTIPGTHNGVPVTASGLTESEGHSGQFSSIESATWVLNSSSRNRTPIVQDQAREETTEANRFSRMSRNPLEDTLDNTAVQLCTTWLLGYAGMPKEQDFEALGRLTGKPAAAIERWFGAKLRSNGPSINDSGYFTGSVSASTSYTRNSELSVRKEQSSGALPSPLGWSGSNGRMLSTLNDGLHLDISQEAVTSSATTKQGIRFDSRTILAGDNVDANDHLGSREVALSRAEGRARSRLGKSCNPTSDANLLKRVQEKPFQCTSKCGKSFARKDDLRRHEEGKYPQRGWVCLVGREVITEGLPQCAYCGEANPPSDHLEKSHKNRLRYCTGGKRSFCETYHYRKEHFRQHFEQIHPQLCWQNYERNCSFEVQNNFPKYCGFCVRHFDTWTWRERLGHICRHFQDGVDMRQWRDPRRNGKPEHNDFHGQEPPDPDDSDDDDDDDGDDRDGSGRDGISKPRYSSGPRFWTSRGPASAAKQNKSPIQDESSQQSHCNQQSCRSENTPKKEDLQIDDEYSGSPRYAVNSGSEHQSGLSQVNGLFPCEAESAQQQVRKNAAQTLYRLGHTTFERVMSRRTSPSERDELEFDSGAMHLPNMTSESDSSLEPPASQDEIKDSKRDFGSSCIVPFNPESFSSLQLLGCGGFSVVDSVVHRGTGSVFARKTMRTTKETQEHFANEMRALRLLHHPHIIQLVGSYTVGHSISMILSSVADMSLSEFIETPAPTSFHSTRLWGQLGCLADALHYIHFGYSRNDEMNDRGAFIGWHQDIKPTNILVFDIQHESDFLLKISDFGCSRFKTSSRTSSDGTETYQRSEAHCGTRMYQPPEASGRLKRSRAYDIWSLGCVFSEVATWIVDGYISQYREYRRKHFQGDKLYKENLLKTYEWLEILRGRAQGPDIPKIDIIKAMLSRDPHKRPTARQICDVLLPGPCCWSELDLLKQQTADQLQREAIKRQHPANQDIWRRNSRKQIKSLRNQRSRACSTSLVDRGNGTFDHSLSPVQGPGESSGQSVTEERCCQ